MTEPQRGPLPGTYWVRHGQLIAGPYPGGWTHNLAQERIDALCDAGVSFFLDLTQPGELNGYARHLPDGVTHERMGIVDMEIPTIAQMCATLDRIDNQLAQGRTVYVHCWGGIGRTGTVIGCWLVRHGLAGDAALREIVRLREGRTNSPQTEDQFDLVRRWSNDHCQPNKVGGSD